MLRHSYRFILAATLALLAFVVPGCNPQAMATAAGVATVADATVCTIVSLTDPTAGSACKGVEDIVNSVIAALPGVVASVQGSSSTSAPTTAKAATSFAAITVPGDKLPSAYLRSDLAAQPGVVDNIIAKIVARRKGS